MKSPLEYPKKNPTKPWYILQWMPTQPQSQFQVTHSIPVRYPLVEQLLLLRAPELTPQRRKLNCFQRNTSTSWWPRSGPKSIKRSSKLSLITKQVRRPVSRVTRVTMRTHRRLRQKTRTMVKREPYLLVPFVVRRSVSIVPSLFLQKLNTTTREVAYFHFKSRCVGPQTLSIGWGYCVVFVGKILYTPSTSLKNSWRDEGGGVQPALIQHTMQGE